MGAGVPLFLCVIIFLWTLANYIFFVALCSIILSLTFLMPMFMIIGPVGEQGDLRALLRLCGIGEPKAGTAVAKTPVPV